MGQADLKIISLNQIKLVWTVIVFFAVTLLPVLGFFTDSIGALSKWAVEYAIQTASDGIPIEKGNYVFAKWAAVTLLTLTIYALCLSAALLALLGSLRALKKSNNASIFSANTLIGEELQSKNALISRLNSTIETQMTDMKKLFMQMFPDHHPLRRDFDKITGRYTVDEEGNIQVEKDVTLSAGDEPVWFWRFYIEGDEWSERANIFTDINFEVESLDPSTDVVAFPVEDGALRKTIILWFLPHIEPRHVRSIRIKYNWPGFLKGLDINGKTNFFWNYDNQETKTLDEFHIEFGFNGRNRDITCKNTGAISPQLDLIQKNVAGSRVWIFSGKKIPVGNRTYELTFYSKHTT